MTKSDKALFRSVFYDLVILAAKLTVFAVSIGILAFVGFHVLAIH